MKRKYLIPISAIAFLGGLTTCVPSSFTFADTSQEQASLKSELQELTKLRDSLQAQVNSAEKQNEELSQLLSNKNSLSEKEKIQNDIKQKSNVIEPIDIRGENLKKVENQEKTNSLKDELIKSNLSDDLAVQLSTGDKIKKLKKEIDTLRNKINVYNDSINKTNTELQKLIKFHFPARGIYTSMYGWRNNPTGEGQDFHTGVDIAGSGDIKAALSGKVVVAGHQAMAGNFVIVDHGVVDGVNVKTLYAHMAQIYVHTGDTVEKAQSVGLMGTTGNSTGVHLHFEVIENGARTNPKPYLDNAERY